MKQTEERHSESRMRAIRTSGSMRGSPLAVIGPRASHPVWVSLLYLGNAALLEHRKVAFLCSTRCAPDRILPAHDKARALRHAGVTVASAFQTPIEQDARDILLRGTAPLIWCRPRGIATLKLQPPWRVPFEEGRVLILTFSPGAPPRATRDQSLHNTRCLLNFAEETYIAHATPGGALEKEIISPPEPLDMGAPLAPEEEWTALCHEGDGRDKL